MPRRSDFQAVDYIKASLRSLAEDSRLLKIVLLCLSSNKNGSSNHAVSAKCIGVMLKVRRELRISIPSDHQMKDN